MEQMPDFAHGCRAGHSREEAILVALTASEKLKKAGYSHVNVFHDMTNAFLCTPHTTLNHNATRHCNTNDAQLLKQRHEQACIQLECPDRSICMRLGVGGMVGEGPVSFMEALHPAVQEWEK